MDGSGQKKMMRKDGQGGSVSDNEDGQQSTPRHRVCVLDADLSAEPDKMTFYSEHLRATKELAGFLKYATRGDIGPTL